MKSRRSLAFVLFLLLLSVTITVKTAYAAKPAEWAGQHAGELVSFYQQFHRNPELSFHEKETAARLAAEWRKAGFQVTERVGGFGVVAVMRNGDGPTVMLRTDLDGLPVAEQTGLPYSSQVRTQDERGATVGVMHACGHDVHITNLIGVARYMASEKAKWRGTLILIGQPAEERGAGAAAMLKDGLFARFPKPDYAVALHVDANLATGKVGTRAGYALANVDSVDITIHGRGGHGAYPHATIDPIVIAAKLILDLQTIVSREVKPIEPAVVTVGSIHGGAKHNVISDDCHLQLTVRSYTDEVRKQIHDAIRRKAQAAAASAGAPEPEVTVSEGTPALFNDERLTARLANVFRKTLGEKNVESSEPSMGGEDFSHYGRAGVPILMFRLGAVSPKRLAAYKAEGRLPPSLHSPLFYPDAEEALKTGVTALSAAALELLQPEK